MDDRIIFKITGFKAQYLIILSKMILSKKYE